MSFVINSAAISRSIAQRAQAAQTINSSHEAMMALASAPPGSMPMEQQVRFGAALEMQAQQAKMMYQVNQLIQEQAQQQQAKDIKLAFGGLGGS